MSRWMIAAKRAEFKEIAEKYGIDQVTARLLRNRDVVGDEAIRDWLYGDLRALHDPHTMKGMEEAAALIRESVSNGERIRIIGDYDVDGICATMILYRGLRAIGAGDLDYILPDRIRDGYGMNETLVRRAYDDGVRMILTCDNGIRAIDEIEKAKELGMRVVVTDHHEPKKDPEGKDILPGADKLTTK